MAASDDLYLIRANNLTWVKYSAVEQVTLDTALEVWSTEFRDIFQSSVEMTTGSAGLAPGPLAGKATVPGLATSIQGSTTLSSATITPAVSPTSDEVAHEDLRQTLLKGTFWKFDRGTSANPRYLYAEYQEGDIIADNPPQTTV